MRKALEKTELDAALQRLPEWKIVDGKLSREFRFRDFADAFAFMSACALRIHALDHHPEWSNVYASVNVQLVTHDAGGITTRDVELAGVMEEMAARFPRG
jgi:4a-hydroxytetrahydrobiopterin dehydratase